MSDPNQKRFTFDPRITTGDILTVIAFLLAGSAAYWSLSSRVSVLEADSATVKAQAASEKSDQRETIRAIRDDIKDVQRSLNQLTLAIGNGGKR